MISYFQAIVIGLLQGVTELFPISSLGHSVLIPAWLGWDHSSSAQSADESFYLAFVVALHVATALALARLLPRATGCGSSAASSDTLRTRRLETPDERMAWLLIVATIPAGLTGLALEHSLRTLFAKPLAAAIFLTRQRRDPARRRAGPPPRRGPRARRRAPDRATAKARRAGASTRSSSRRPARSASRRSARCSPASAARASRWSPASCAASTTRTRPASRSCSRRRSSSPPASTRSPTSPATSATASAARPSSAASSPGSPPSRPCGSSMRFFETRNLMPFAIYCLAFGTVSIIRFA